MPSSTLYSTDSPTTTDDIAVRPRGLASNPELVTERIHRAANLDALVTHNAPGMYNVETTDGDTYTVDLLSGDTHEPTAACTCPDYNYRCRKNGIDCKHILLVKHRIKNHVLAPPSMNPEVWMRDYADELLTCLTALDIPATTQTHIENTLLLAGETTYGIDPRALARWTLIQTQH